MATVRFDKPTALEGHNERFVIRVDSRHPAPALGDTVFVKPRVGSHHAFHATTGERLRP
jgi:multiple sugar transport system ATP-binding protein